MPGCLCGNGVARLPDLSYGPAQIPIGDFELAWLEMDEAFAVIAP